MIHITESILSYISRDETDYALLITGGWGTGKTFYFKEVFKEKLEEKHSDYKLIYVSLYGISSIKEISILIYDQINPLKAKAMKYGGFLSKVALRGMDLSELFSLELGSGEDKKVIKGDSKSMSEHFSDFFRINKQKIDKSKILLCFDDLERKDSSLTITQISGFINSLLEEQTKVIVIANSNQVKEEEFTFLKEKTFGVQLEFPKNNKQNVVQLINKTFEKYPLFRDWLKSKIEYFDNIFFQFEDNLRVFKLALQHFHKVYSYIESQKFNYKYIIFEELYNDILRFICAVTIEFRKGKLSYYERNDIDNNFWTYTDMLTKEQLLNMSSQGRPKKEDSVPPVPNFKEIYYGGIRYKFYKSIYDLITSEYLSNIDLGAELEELNIDVKKEEYIVLEKIGENYGTYHYSDIEYKKILLESLEFAYKGMYTHINNYSTIYSAVNFRSSNYDISIDKSRFFSAVREIIEKETTAQLNDNLRFYGYIKEEYENSVKEFYSKVCDITREEISKREKLKLQEIEQRKDFNKLTLLFEEKLTKNFIIDENIVDVLYQLIISTEIMNLYKLRQVFYKRYEKNYIEENSKLELNSLKELIFLLNGEVEKIGEEEPNRRIQFEGIINIIGRQIKRIETPTE